MTSRALRFGAAATAYERFRPGYPDALAERVFAYAGDPIRTALEIGAGTGKATRLFAAHGVAVTATDPDAKMLAELRAHVPESVVTLQAPFEQVNTSTTYDLVFAAASLHWTNPQRRWDRVAALLRPGGVFASFGGPNRLADEALERTVNELSAPFLGSADVPPPEPPVRRDGTGEVMPWPGTELLREPQFEDVQQSTIPRRAVMPAGHYLGLLSTVSAYLELSDDRRAELFTQIAVVLPDQVEVCSDITLHLARRR